MDERHQTDPRKINAYIRFSTERMSTGDFKGILMKDAAKLVTSEWKALSADERQVRRVGFSDLYNPIS